MGGERGSRNEKEEMQNEAMAEGGRREEEGRGTKSEDYGSSEGVSEDFFYFI